MKYLKIKVYFTSFTVLKKKALKMKKKSYENDRSTGHFQSFFSFSFFVPSTLNLKKIPVNQLMKKFWPFTHDRFLYSLCRLQKYSALH